MPTKRQSAKSTGRSQPKRATHSPRAKQLSTTGASENPDDRRERILNAAIAEFSRNGLAGARTEAIAASAGVNKALLYYYFHSKTELYAAALDACATQVLESALQSLEHEGSAGERMLRTALNHFDRIASQHEYRQLINQEMARLREDGHDGIPTPLEKIFTVLTQKMRRVLTDGMKTGELIRTDWTQVIYSGLGANIFYFLSAPVMRQVAGFDPLQEHSIRRRRKAAILFLGAALFSDRRHGERLAQRVLADTPAPALGRARMFLPRGVPTR